MSVNLKLMVAAAGVSGLLSASSICLPCTPFTRESTVALANGADTARVKLAIKGMTCGGCAAAARIALLRAAGVYKAEVSFETASAVVQYDPKSTNSDALIAHLKKATGFEARVVSDQGPAPPPKGPDRGN